MPDTRPARALIVEDEQLIAMMTEDMLIELGHDIAATAHSLATGLACAADAAIDFAVLDINLNGERSFPIADALSERGIPFLFLTGFGINGLSERYKAAPILAKPFSMDALARMIDRIVAR